MERRTDGWVFRLFLLLAGLFMQITIMPRLADAAPLSGGVSILADDAITAFELAGRKTELGKLDLVAVKDQRFNRAMRIATSADPGVEWDIQVRVPTTGPVKAGDVLLANFWVRCVDSMTGEGFAGFVMEQSKTPFDKAVEMRVGAPANWTECFVPFKSPRDFAAGEAQVCFRVGFDRQTIEVGGLELLNYGQGIDVDQLPRTKLTYAGREVNAPWRKAALERIEQIRKGDLAVKIVDAAGVPVPNANIHIQLKHHLFGFGSCVTVDQITGDKPEDIKAREIIEKYFSRVVFENDMKWPAMWNGVPPKLEESVDWLLARHIEIRGHNLQWPSWNWSPKQLRAFENDPVELRRLCAERVTSAVGHFKGKLVQWDVINEPYNNVDLQKILGDDVMVDWFKLARAADPACKLFVNDFGIFDGGPNSEHRQHYFKTITTLREKGAPLDGIGIQSHFGAVMPGPTQLLAVLDQFSSFGLPIESTEFSLNNDDRQLQADYLRDYMIAVFSHPNVDGIMLWGFWEGRHWRPNAALWTRDWKLRPHGQAWIDLMNQWTTDVDVKSDASGAAKTRGFLGTYEIKVDADGKSKTAQVELGHEGQSTTIVLE